MTLWISLTVIFMTIMVISWILSKIYNESIDDDSTLSGMGFSVGAAGMIFFGMITILCI